MIITRPPTPENQNPIADASAGEPYKGFVGEEIIFDGSNSFDPDTDGYIWEWHWDFGDGKNATGEKIKHVYEKNGTYEVNLTVTDNREGNDSDIFEVIIVKANHPPSKPVINGPEKGKQNNDYEFSATSSDLDNDSIQYVFDWGDGEQTITKFLATGNTTYQLHNWTKYGKYVVCIYAQDNDSESETSEITILIDILPISGLISGNLIDLDSDNTFEMFENSDNGVLTDVGFDNGTYLIDSNSNNVWDHSFNIAKGIMTYYEYLYQKYYQIIEKDLENLEILESPGFEIIIVLTAVLLMFFVLKRRI
jgi:PKD repeat protein